MNMLRVCGGKHNAGSFSDPLTWKFGCCFVTGFGFILGLYDMYIKNCFLLIAGKLLQSRIRFLYRLALCGGQNQIGNFFFLVVLDDFVSLLPLVCLAEPHWFLTEYIRHGAALMDKARKTPFISAWMEVSKSILLSICSLSCLVNSLLHIIYTVIFGSLLRNWPYPMFSSLSKRSFA